MIELFEAVERCELGSVNIAVTALEPEYLGEKALISNGQIVWKSSAKSFFDGREEAVSQLQESGIETVDGCKVFCDTLGQEKHLVVCGGGHVSIPVIKIGIMMGMKVTVLEDRPKFADNARRAGADQVICEPFAEALDQILGSSDTYFVIVTRGHRYDQVCLEKITQKEHAYIGMIGSRRRVALVKRLLVENGCDQEVLDEVYTPIGLDIGAETPVEIGVAIMAEIIEVKNKKKRTFGYSKDMIRVICDEEKYPDAKVMATIITRKGSAPQGIGVKMLVLADGTCIGTIGGGCMESNILQKALQMIRNGESGARICHVDLTGADAEDEGMVCGGIADVLMEMISGEV